MPTSTRPGTGPDARLPGASLGRYRLGARIGEGGMAEVFRGEIEGAAGFSKAVAIKRVRASLAQDAGVCEAFVQEARVARRMEHGNIVQIYDLGSEDGVPYLVLELVDGASLADILAARRAAGQRLAVADALYLVEHVAAALHHAHQLTDEAGHPAGVIHRDVTPRNILVSRAGVVKLADFGIAKARHLPSETLPGTIKGTLGYLSPEQASGAPVDARSDQFSTGLVLYEMLAGENPLAAADNLQAYFQMLSEGVPPLPLPPSATTTGADTEADVDEALAAIVSRAVAVRPGDRFPSMADLQAELEAWRVGHGIRTGPDGLRRTVRAILGAGTTDRALARPVRLDDALGAEMAARAPRQTQAQPAAPAPGSGKQRWSRWLPAVLGAGALGIAATVWLAGGAGANGPGQEPSQRQERTPSQPQTPGQSQERTPGQPQAHEQDQRQTDGKTNGKTEERQKQPRSQEPSRRLDPGPAEAPQQPRSPEKAPAEVPARPRSPRADPAAARAPHQSSRRPGRVQINLLPYAQVHVDGRALGTTPVDVALPPGPHTLVLENPDTGQRQRRSIQLTPGQVLRIRTW